MESQKIRLFIGSPVTGQAYRVLEGWYAARELYADLLPARLSWVPPQNWHLTWLFIGEVLPEELPEIQEQLKKVLNAQEPISLTMEGLSLWPHRKAPRMLVWEGAHQQAAVTVLAQALRKTFPEYWSLGEKPFTPHITLARFKENYPKPYCLPEGISLSPQSWEVQEVHLYQSSLQPTGALYHSCIAYPLK